MTGEPKPMLPCLEIDVSLIDSNYKKDTTYISVPNRPRSSSHPS